MFLVVKFSIYLNRRVFVMALQMSLSEFLFDAKIVFGFL